MEKEIDVEHLISLVSQQPVIWDKNSPDFHSRALTDLAWREVCGQLDTHFNDKTDRDKSHYSKMVLSRWRNIRDQWQKACKKVACQNRTGSTRKAKKYIYHDQLSFLIQAEDAKSQESSFSEENKPELIAVNVEECDSLVEYMPSKRARLVTNGEESESIYKDPLNLNLHSFMLDIKREADDPKLSFFKSILPSVADFTSDEFLHLQSRTLCIIQDIKMNRKFPNRSQSIQQHVCTCGVHSSQCSYVSSGPSVLPTTQQQISQSCTSRTSSRDTADL
ncbi:uncharacterized protein LOC124360110 [Homalodisca vitripennis]|uniref:uncharacterized protein LOC124360110 n=1 Tax=Homalodisca vitripennis TaxID=197043 RepID=UPI001EEAC8EA|nr:uncharacterized protein LOC124360110 [Homalodisca vitripennis]